MRELNSRRKVSAYVDGFNLYYGLLKSRPELKWLNLMKLVKMLCPHYDVAEVKYFSAEVDGFDVPRKVRQRTYWRALEESGVKIIKGRLETRQKVCHVIQCAFAGSRTYPEAVEKMTDVNLAIHIVTDARVQEPDLMCIISGDTDLIPAMDMVRANFPCQRKVFIPCREEILKYRRVDQFEMLTWTTNRLKEEVIINCRFPDVISTTDGAELKCPARWLKPQT